MLSIAARAHTALPWTLVGPQERPSPVLVECGWSLRTKHRKEGQPTSRLWGVSNLSFERTSLETSAPDVTSAAFSKVISPNLPAAERGNFLGRGTGVLCRDSRVDSGWWKGQEFGPDEGV